MNILIIEDEEMAAIGLTNMLQKLQSVQPLRILAILKSVKQAILWFSNHPDPDLIILDVELADGSCFDLMDSINRAVPTIFTTAYDQYAIEAFELNSVAYLLKPYSGQQLEAAITKYHKLNFSNMEKALKQIGRSGALKSRFLVRQKDAIQTIPIEEIAFFHKDIEVFLVTHDGQWFEIQYGLDQLETMLDPKLFFRLNRQFVANIRAVKQARVYPKSRYSVELAPDPKVDIIISQEKSKYFRKWLDQ